MTRSEERATEVANARLTSACAHRSPALASHVSTGEGARDVDRMRAAVGDAQLTMVGYSYGSYLATVYANLFPGKVRAIVADGAINPRAWRGRGRRGHRVPIDVRLRSDTGTSSSLQVFLRACDRHPRRCAFAPPGWARSSHKLHRLMRALRSRRIHMGGVATTYADAVSNVRFYVYDVDRWTALGRYLEGLWRHRAGAHASRTLVSSRASERQRQPVRSGGYQNYLDIAEAVTCGDSHNPTNPQAWVNYGRRRDRVAPYFGRWWTWLDEACATWSLPSPGRYTGRFDHVTANPVLVVGNVHDPATRYQDAVTLTRILPRARLLTVDGTGHTTLGLDSTCAAKKTAAYLLRGTLPPAGTVCHTDGQPFH